MSSYSFWVLVNLWTNWSFVSILTWRCFALEAWRIVSNSFWRFGASANPKVISLSITITFGTRISYSSISSTILKRSKSSLSRLSPWAISMKTISSLTWASIIEGVSSTSNLIPNRSESVTRSVSTLIGLENTFLTLYWTSSIIFFWSIFLAVMITGILVVLGFDFFSRSTSIDVWRPLTRL